MTGKNDLSLETSVNNNLKILETDQCVRTPNIDNIEQNKEGESRDIKPKKPPASKKTKLKKLENEIPRGKPKSGRPWKSVKTKFSTVKKSMHRRNFEKKMEFRNEIKHIKELSNSIKEQKKQDNEMKRQRRLENAQRRLENEKKSEIVQVIKNPAKLKRMKKKQLRMIEKRDLSKVKTV